MARSDWKRPEYKSVEEGFSRIKLVIAYDGRPFHGWQRQDGEATVQGEIERVLESVLGSHVDVYGSGRTDAGVHALGQVAHFDTNSKIEAEKFAIILNTKLPHSIRVLSSSRAEEPFHARFTAMAREYIYKCKLQGELYPFDDGLYLPLRAFPDIKLLNSYASILLGTHDFTTFASARDICPSKFRDIYESVWTEGVDSYGCRVISYRVAGNAFLYNQVRSMVGTMLTAAAKAMSAEAFNEILLAKDRSLAFKTADAHGLYLSRISYDESEYLWFEEGKRDGK